MRTPKLKKINLNKICGNGNEHPDIRRGVYYLIQYNGALYAGTFSRQHYGWNFNGVYGAGMQLTYPGLEAIWQIMK